MEEFFTVREDLYVERKDYLLRKMNRDLMILNNKIRFITEVIEEKIEIRNKPKKVIYETLAARNYNGWEEIQDLVPEEVVGKTKGEVGVQNLQLQKNEDGEESEGEGAINGLDFDYLLKMAIWSLTKEKIEKMKEAKFQKEDDIKILEAKHIHEIWNEDLDQFEEQLRLNELEEQKLAEKLEKKGKKGKKQEQMKRKKRQNSEDGIPKRLLKEEKKGKGRKKKSPTVAQKQKKVTKAKKGESITEAFGKESKPKAKPKEPEDPYEGMSLME